MPSKDTPYSGKFVRHFLTRTIASSDITARIEDDDLEIRRNGSILLDALTAT